MKQSTRTGFFLILIQILVVILGTLAAGMLFFLYELCHSMVAGVAVSADLDLFIKGLLVGAPFAIAVSSLFLVFYLIRHPAGAVFPLSVVSVAFLVNWMVLIPGCHILFGKYESKSMESSSGVETLSAGYFRQKGPYVMFFSKVGKDNVGNGVVLDLNQNVEQEKSADFAEGNGNSMYVFPFTETLLPPPNADYADSLVESSLKMPGLLAFFFSHFAVMEAAGYDAIQKNYLSWIFFMSFGLAMAGLVALRDISRWRLVNFIYVLIGCIVILEFNVFCYLPSFFTPMVLKFQGLFGDRIGMDNALAFMFNTLSFVILFIIGLVADLKRHKKTVLAGDDDL